MEENNCLIGRSSQYGILPVTDTVLMFSEKPNGGKYYPYYKLYSIIVLLIIHHSWV